MSDPASRAVLLERLANELRPLRCVARPMKDWVLETAAPCLSDEHLRAYLDGPLAFLRADVEPIRHRRFRGLCQTLGNIEDGDEVLRALGIEEEANPWAWLEYARAVAPTPDRMLFCLANRLAHPGPRPYPVEETLARMADLLLPCLASFVPAAGARLASAMLGLPEQVDSSFRLDRLTEARERLREGADSLVQVLAHCLVAEGQDQKALSLYVAWAAAGGMAVEQAFESTMTRLRQHALGALASRLQAADWLAEPTRQLVWEIARRSFVLHTMVRDYLDGRLAFLEQQTEGLSDPGFRALCDRLADEDDPQTILAVLGVEGEFEPDGWLGLGQGLLERPAELLYCVLNHAVLPLLRLGDYPELRPAVRGLIEHAGALFRLTSRGPDPLADIAERLSRLDFVPAWMRAESLGLLRRLPVAVPAYRERLLPFLETELTAVKHPAFRRLCERLHAVEDPAELAAILGAHEPLHPAAWFTLGSDRILEPAISLYCLANHFASPLTGLVPQLEASGLGTLAQGLGFLNERPRGVRLLEEYLAPGGLPADDDRLAEVLHRFRERIVQPPEDLDDRLVTAVRGLAEHAGEVVAAFVNELADGLRMLGRSGDSLRLLVTFLGLGEPASWTREGLARQLEQGLAGLPPLIASVNVRALAESLETLGRWQHALLALETYLRLEPADYGDDARLRRRLGQALDDVSPVNSDSVVHALAAALMVNDRSDCARQVLEAWLNLPAEAYSEPAALAAWHDAELSTRQVYVAAGLVRRLAETLCLQQEYASALALICCFLRLNPDSDFADQPTAVAALAPVLGRLTESGHAAALLDELTAALSACGRHAEAAVLQETQLGLGPEDYRQIDGLRARLAETVGRLPPDIAATAVGRLAQALLRAGRMAEATAVVGAHCGTFDELDAEQPTVSALNATPLLTLWLALFGQEWRGALDVARRALRFLRRSVGVRGMTPADRRRFIESVTDLRRLVLGIGHYWLGLTRDTAEANLLRNEVLLWDAELGQRLLVERFLADGPIIVISDRVEAPARGAWPLRYPRPGFAGHLPELADDLAPARDAVLSLRRTAALPVSEPQSAGPPDWLDEAEELIRPGVDGGRLAAALGPGTVLLRACFLEDGQLRWSAVRSDGTDLELLAHEHTGHDTFEERIVHSVFALSDRGRLRWAVALHDFRLDLLWLSQQEGIGEALLRLPSEVMPLLEEVSRLLGWVTTPEGIATQFIVNQSREPAEEVLEPMRAWHRDLAELPGLLADLAERLAASPLGGAAQRLVRAVEPLLRAPSLACRGAGWARVCLWATETAKGWQQLIDLFGSLQTSRPLSPAELRNELDRATSGLIEAVARVWKLDALAETLVPDTDLVVQADDVLHAVPIAHLPVAGRPLFARVRSVRVAHSALLTLLQQHTEERSQSPAGRLLTVSWFDAEEPPAIHEGAARMHHGQGNLAARHGLEWHAAGDGPAGSRSALAAAAPEGWRVVTVLGHGNEEASGIELADGLWRGQGCDLGNVELLIQLSCSIGRLRQSTMLDIEGFCAELALARTRSVLACRWPIHCLEAPAFANEVASQYLQLGQTHAPDRPIYRDALRATALNRARQRFLAPIEGEAPLPHAGLNTIAAFELYGLG